MDEVDVPGRSGAEIDFALDQNFRSRLIWLRGWAVTFVGRFSQAPQQTAACGSWGLREGQAHHRGSMRVKVYGRRARMLLGVGGGRFPPAPKKKPRSLSSTTRLQHVRTPPRTPHPSAAQQQTNRAVVCDHMRALRQLLAQ